MRQKKVFWLVGIGTVFVFLGLYWMMQFLLNPYRVYAQFLDVVERKDINRIYAMVLDEEKQDGLTREMVQRLMDWMLYRHAMKVQGKTVFITPPADRWFRAGVLWVNAETDQPLTLDGRRIRGYINLFRPPKRWRWQVSFTHFVKDYLHLNIAHISLRQQGWTEEMVRADRERYERLREDLIAKWLKQFGIIKVFPLPSRTKMRGRYVAIWKE